MQADALSRLRATVEAQNIDDLEILCFVVGNDEGSTKGRSDGIYDNILASETLKPPHKGPFTRIKPEELIRE